MRRHRVLGLVDTVHQGRVAGWAADPADLTRTLTVNVYVGGRRVATTPASEYRPDLERAGIGDGRHAFDCDISASLEGDTRTISVEVEGSDDRLKYHGAESFDVETPSLIRYVAADIVNNCNLRCPFCVVDYSGVNHTETMSEKTFRRLLGLLPLVPEGGFWLSCLHEPTLHPRLDDLIEAIPREHRHKAWFTTNLARPLSDATFERWARSGLHHINVSLDTLQPELFPILRKFGNFRKFCDNLDRMSAAFRSEPAAPKLRYITVAFRSNLDEIPKLVEHSCRHWLSSENEIRYTINVAHITDEFREAHHLRREDWPVLTRRLEASPGRCMIVPPPSDEYETTREAAANYFETHPVPTQSQRPSFPPPFELRARPNGNLVVVGHESEFTANVNEIDDPLAFFTRLAGRSPTS